MVGADQLGDVEAGLFAGLEQLGELLILEDLVQRRVAGELFVAGPVLREIAAHGGADLQLGVIDHAVDA